MIDVFEHAEIRELLVKVRGGQQFAQSLVGLHVSPCSESFLLDIFRDRAHDLRPWDSVVGLKGVKSTTIDKKVAKGIGDGGLGSYTLVPGSGV